MRTIASKSRFLVGALLALVLVMGLGYAVLAAPTSGTVTVKFVQGASNLSGPLTLEAIAPNGYEFDHWEVDGQDVGSDNPLTITLDGNKEIQAVFVALADPGSTAITLASFTARSSIGPQTLLVWTCLAGAAILAIGGILWVRRRANGLGRTDY